MNEDMKPINKSMKDLTKNDYEQSEWKNSDKANVLNKTDDVNKRTKKKF